LSTIPHELAASEIDRRAAELRLRGYNFRQIGEAIGRSEQCAWDAVQRVARLTREATQGRAEQVRELELQRLDALLAKVWDRATDTQDEQQLAAVATVLRVSERRARLLGLDAPVQVNVLEDPRVADALRAGYAVVARVLDVLAPELVAVVQEAIGVWQGQGADALDAWLAERAPSVVVEANG
jgi:hypothetical protein